MLVYLNRITYEITVPSYGLCGEWDLFFATSTTTTTTTTAATKHAFHPSMAEINKVNSCESHHNKIRGFWFVL
jgi:hypothetical protein